MLALYSLIVGALFTLVLGVAPPGRPQDLKALALLVFLCLLTFKVLLDDAVHFHDSKKNHRNWTHGLPLSILWNLLMLGAVHASVVDAKRAMMYATLALLAGTIWLVRNYFHAPGAVDAPELARHRGWAYINAADIAVLTVLITYFDTADPALISGALIALCLLTIFDIVRFKTFQRVAGAFNEDKPEQ